MTKQNALRLTKLINNLIDITKLDNCSLSLHKKNVNIVTIIEDISMSTLDYINTKGIELIFDTNVEEKYISCDPDALERIILNLLSNAIKFTPRGGKILVKINCINDLVYVSVEDTGIGIEKSNLDKIFNRFFQCENDNNTLYGKGSGIGLSLVKSLINLHNGDISVTSKINKGTTFTFTLPAVLDDYHIDNIDENTITQNSDNKKIEITNIEFSDIYCS